MKPLVRRVVVQNRRGLHARAAAKVVAAVERFNATVEVAYDGQIVPALSIMGLLMLGAAFGAELELRAMGDQAAEALAGLQALIERRFDEVE